MTPQFRFAPGAAAVADPRWVALYVVTLALQALCALARALVFFIPVGILFAIPGISGLVAWTGNDPASSVCTAVAFAPLAYSLLALIYPVGAGAYWRTQIGGRRPSEREREIYNDVLATLRERDPTMRVPRSWFVIDDYQVNGAVLGDTLMLSTGTLTDTALEPVLAHELGHLNTIDGRLTVSLNSLALPATLFARVDRALGDGCLVRLFMLIGWVCSGELVLVFLRPFWDAWFRAREFKADQYAARLGHGRQLADMLQRDALTDDHPIPFRFLSGASHPPTEHRIQALNNHDRQHHAAAQ